MCLATSSKRKILKLSCVKLAKCEKGERRFADVAPKIMGKESKKLFIEPSPIGQRAILPQKERKTRPVTLIPKSGVLLQKLHRIRNVMLLGKNDIRAMIKGVSFMIGKAILSMSVGKGK